MITDQVTVYRRVERDGEIVIESVTATLADDIQLDDLTEALRRSTLASALFRTLPSVIAENEARYFAQHKPVNGQN